MTLKRQLRTYIKFKEQSESEHYIYICVSHHKISLLAQFRMGILHIGIETSIFKNISVEERVCLLYNMNYFEDKCIWFEHVCITM